MNIKTILSILQIAVATLLIMAVLLQSRGSGLSSIFGGEGGFYRSKRGLEKSLFSLTIVLASLLLILSFANVILGS